MEKLVLVSSVLLLLSMQGARPISASSDRARLASALLGRYNPTIIPSTPLTVTNELGLVNVLNVDTDANLVELIVWHTQQWKDTSLVWDPADFNNISKVRLPADTVWTPDLHIYNSVSPIQTLSPDIVVVAADGLIIRVPSQRIQFSCDLQNVSRKSGAVCKIKIGSWTYSGNLLALGSPRFQQELVGTNNHYEVLELSAKKNTNVYACCPEPYEDVEFSFTIRRKDHNSWF